MLFQARKLKFASSRELITGSNSLPKHGTLALMLRFVLKDFNVQMQTTTFTSPMLKMAK
jgi:hypothetical protein